MVKSTSVGSKGPDYNFDGGGASNGNCYDSCFAAKSSREHRESCENVTKKVHSILKSLDIPIYCYDDELNNLRDNISKLGESLRWNRMKVFNLDNDLNKTILGVRKGVWK